MEQHNIFDSRKKTLFKSLRSRIFFLTSVFGLIIGISAISIGYTMYSGSADRFYAEKAIETGNTAAALIDKKDAAITRDEVIKIYEEESDKLYFNGDPEADDGSDELLKRGKTLLDGEHKESFANIERLLHTIRDSTPEDDFVYYMTYDNDREWMIFIVDTIDEEDNQSYFSPCTPWKVFRQTKDLLADPAKGGYTVNSTGSGMVVSKACPVYGEDGEELGYIGVDVMLSDIIRHKRIFLFQYCLMVGGIVLILSILLLHILSVSIVAPIEKL